MIVALLDANVLSSGIVATEMPGSKTGEILRRWFDGRISVVLSDYVLDEVRRTLATKRYFREVITPAVREAALVAMRDAARIVEPAIVPGVAPHRHDDAVLATVAASGADWFVTGDAALLAIGVHAGVPFANPARFLAELDAASGER